MQLLLLTLECTGLAGAAASAHASHAPALAGAAASDQCSGLVSLVGALLARAAQQFLPMTENGIQCEPALAAAADIPQLLAAALSPLHLPYLLRYLVARPAY